MAFTPPGETRDKVFRFVRDRILSGSVPSVREVQLAMGFAAVESARKQLDALVAEGRLEKDSGLARSYRLPRARGEARATQVPVLGTVQAGQLQEAIENPDGWVLVESRHRPEDLFALRVRGDSMIEAGILPDDLVVVRKGSAQPKGAIVVAMVGDEATVKRLGARRGKVVLEPANRAYQPIVAEPSSVRVLGRVIEVRRQLG
ncbi:MAG: repressor LexA [Planctomycetes bacterium]|nr:repressor LexA [Planctomycetota bacterium]